MGSVQGGQDHTRSRVVSAIERVRSKNLNTPCIMCVQYGGGDEYRWGVQYRGGYHEYRGGFLEYRGGVQYRGEIS